MFFRKTSRLILFLGLWMVGGFQIIQGETEIIPPKVQYFVDSSRQLTVEEVDKHEMFFQPWGRSTPSEILGNPGNIWIRIDPYLKSQNYIYELKSTFLVKFRAYLKNTYGYFENKSPLQNTFGIQPAYLLPKSESEAMFLLVDQEYGFHLLQNTFFSEEEYQALTQRRVLIFSAVMGAFFMSLILVFLAGTKDTLQMMLFLLLSAAFLGVVFELKIFNYAGFDFDTVMYFRIFSINTFIGPSIYLLVIAKELISFKFQKYIKIFVLILLGSFLFHLVYPSQIAWQLITLLVLISLIIILSMLIGSWASNPEYRFITVIMVLGYIPLIPSMSVIQGILDPEYWIWDPNLRIAVPIFLTHLLYLKREQRLKMLALELDQKNEQLREVDRYKDLFLERTSHELRTPLNAIIGFGENLLESARELTRFQQEKLNWIVHSASRMSRLIRDLNDFTRIRESDLEINLNPEKFQPILELVKPVLEMDFKNKGLSWREDVGEDLPRIMVDPQRLQQVLINLIGNAVKYTHQGGVSISAKQMEDFLEINLSDTGVGIPEKELDQVMKDYQRGSNTFTTPGQGLGLSLSRFLIEKQNGTFEVFSQENQGTRIRILLPLVSETESLPEQTGVPKETQESLVQQSSGLDDKAANASKDSSQEDLPFAKILVVDDEPLNLRLVENHLEGMNYELLCYQDGNQALESLNQDDPDLILLDLMMPGVDGYEVIKVIRSNYLQSQLPIIVITANQQEHVTRKSIQLGANDYLIKPYSAEELRVRINSQLRISKQQIMQEEMEMLQEREKKERAERLRVNRILDDLNISLAMVDAQGTILQINKEFQRMFGFSQSQAQGKQMKELLGLEEFEFKDKHSEISLRDVSGKRIKMSVRSNRVELQEQDEYIVIMIPAETSEQETEPVLTRFSQVNADSESTEEIDPNELLRQKLCNLLNLSVKYYEYATGNNYTSLALDSGLWHATLNGTTYRAYMMERYMNPERIPGKFKWGVVIKTAEWVLENCEEHQELKNKILKEKTEIEDILL